MAEATGLEPASDKCAVVFKTTALPVRLPFQNLLIVIFAKCWQGRSDLNRESRFWRPMVCRLAYIPELESGACGRIRTYEVTPDA
jgi:hypothetical protein